MKLLVVIQARMGSTRLPGKVMLPLAGKPLLERMVERVRGARTPFDLVIATSTDAQDEPIRELGKGLSVPVFSGHATDLLDRHLRAAEAFAADAVVKIPSDCPAIDPQVIDRVVGAYLHAPGQYALVTNLNPPSWPDGNDVEVMSYNALQVAWRFARSPHEREHTTPYLWDNPQRFAIRNVSWEKGDYSASHRLTIDYEEDYLLLDQVFTALYRPGDVFGVQEIIDLLDRRPELKLLNARWLGSSWHLGCLDRLATVSRGDAGLLWRRA